MSPRSTGVAITAAHVEDYAASVEADFALELRVAGALKRADWTVMHGGSFVDPVSGKNRQFDVRAQKRSPEHELDVRLAIECKNVSAESPIVVMTRPAWGDEHALQFYTRWTCSPLPPSYQEHDCVVSGRVLGLTPGFQCGKDIAQVWEVESGSSRHVKKMSRSRGEWDPFTACTQALHAAADQAMSQDLGEPRWVALPIVVVPDSRLFAAHFNADGSFAAANDEQRVVMHLGHLGVDPVNSRQTVKLPHVWIMTESSFCEWLEQDTCWFVSLARTLTVPPG